MYMKHMNGFLVVVMALALTVGGCGRKEKEGGTSTSGNPATTSGSVTNLSERTMDNVGSELSKEQLDKTPVEEQVRQVRLNNSVLVGSIAVFGSSFLVEKYANRIAAYITHLASVAEKQKLKLNPKVGVVTAEGPTQGTILRYKDKVLKEFDEAAYKAARAEYGITLQKTVAAIKKAHPEMTAGEALAKIGEKGKTSMLNGRLAKIEERYLKGQFAEKVEAKALRGLFWGAHGMRILAGFGFAAWTLYDVVSASELSDVDVTSEDRLESYEAALRNYKHDPENVFWQNEVIRTASEFLPDLIAVLELQVGVTQAQIAEMNTEKESVEKTEIFGGLTTALSQQERDLSFYQSMFNMISAEGDEDAVLEIMSNNMDKITQLSAQQ